MGILDKFFDKEQATHDTIQDALENIATELGCDYNSFFVMIKSKDEEFSPSFHIYQMQATGAPKYVREITIKEILGDNDSEQQS